MGITLSNVSREFSIASVNSKNLEYMAEGEVLPYDKFLEILATMQCSWI
jgi:hypothetical protein